MSRNTTGLTFPRVENVTLAPFALPLHCALRMLTRGDMKAKTPANKDFKPGTQRDKTRQEILRLCRGKFLTKREIASDLGLSLNTVRAYYLYPMVDRGQIELRNSDHPRSYNQGYRAKK